MTTRVRWLGVLAVLSACNSGAPSFDGGVDAGSGVDVDAGIADAGADAGTPDAGLVAFADYNQRVSESFCTKVFECCSATEVSQIFNGAFTDRASCIASLVSQYDQRRPEFEASLDAGRLSYDPGTAGACVAGFADLTCATFNRWFGPPACRGGVFQVFAGLVPDGGACAVTEDCGGVNAICFPMGDGGQSCVGAADVGEPCGNPAVCLPGSRCVGGSTLPPPPPVCNAELPLGAACQVGSQCASQTCGRDGGSSDTCQPTRPLCTGQ